MKYYLASISIIIFSVFSLPTTVFAGSCGCLNTNIIDPNNATFRSCVIPSNVSSQTECDTRNNTSDASWQYSECRFYTNNNCLCTATGMFQSSKTCTASNDCNVGAGTSYCCDNVCFFDQTALSAYNLGLAGAADFEKNIKVSKPILSISIPGVNFSDASKVQDSQGTMVVIPYLAEYIKGVYQFAMIAGSMVAVVVIILNGFRITISAGGPEKNKGIQNITKAITGLFILWSSYALLSTINPNLTQLNALNVRYVEPRGEPEQEEMITTAGTTAASEASIVDISGDNISFKRSGIQLDQNVLKMVQAAAADLNSQGIRLYITDGYRSIDAQKALITQNCVESAGAQQCTPKPGRPITCILRDLDPKNCPHTTARAVDVWGMKDGQRCIMQSSCSSNPTTDACRKDPCQAAVITAMKSAGFCNLSFEAWHFEYPKMSAACN